MYKEKFEIIIEYYYQEKLKIAITSISSNGPGLGPYFFISVSGSSLTVICKPR